MTKFGFIRSGKGEIFWRKTQRNETKAQLNDLERRRLQAYPFCFDVSMHPKESWKDFMLSNFSLDVFKFDFCLLTDHFQSFTKTLNEHSW